MRILMLHNRYVTLGGEDISTRVEADMMRDRGHTVDLWEASNDGLADCNLASIAVKSVWSASAARALSKRLNSVRYDIVHVQNFFPQFSPVVHRVAHRHGVASVQHLRNFRYTCTNASLFRDGATCMDCIGKLVPWHGVIHGCYRGSRVASATVAAMVGVHKLTGTWSRSVTRYIAVSDYVREVHVRAGIPAGKIAVRPNVAIMPYLPEGREKRNVFVAARLVPEKGVQTVIAAWKMRARNGHQLRIAGAGPYEIELRSLAGDDPSIVFLGQIDLKEVALEMAGAHIVIVPSIWAEPFGRTAVEAMAAGALVLASDVGGLPDILGKCNEVLYPAGDSGKLDILLTKFVEVNPSSERLKKLQAGIYLSKFNVDSIYYRTMQIYKDAIDALR